MLFYIILWKAQAGAVFIQISFIKRLFNGAASPGSAYRGWLPEICNAGSAYGVLGTLYGIHGTEPGFSP